MQLGLHCHTLPERRIRLFAAYLKLHALPHDLLHLLWRGRHKQDPGAYVFMEQALKLGMLCRDLHLQGGAEQDQSKIAADWSSPAWGCQQLHCCGSRCSAGCERWP